jgi:hypothetical protein
MKIGKWIKLNHDFDNEIDDVPDHKEGDTFLVAGKSKMLKKDDYVWEVSKIKMIDGKFMVIEKNKIVRPWKDSWADVSMYCRVTEEINGPIEHVEEEQKDTKLTFSVPPRKKGLVINIAADGEYAGFGASLSGNKAELILGFFAIRCYFMNEKHLECLNTVLNFNKVCSSHSFDLKELLNKKKKDE